MGDMENRIPENEKSLTKEVPTVAPSPRRRRSERYRAAEASMAETGTETSASAEGVTQDNAIRYTGRPVTEAESATAREVARRFRMEEMDGAERQPLGRQASARNGGTGAARIPQGSEKAGDRRNPFAARELNGYAPGRMGNADRGRVSEEARARLAAESRGQAGSETSSRYIRGRNESPTGRAGAPGGTRKAVPYGEEREESRRHRGLVPMALTILLLLAGAVLLILLVVPEDMGGPLGMIRQALTGSNRELDRTAAQVAIFSVDGGEGAAPADVAFTVAFEGEAPALRLVDDDENEIPARRVDGEGAAANIQTLVWDLGEAWEGMVHLQIRVGEEWQDTGRQVEIRITEGRSLPESTVTPESVVFTTDETEQAEEKNIPFQEEDGWDAESEGQNENGSAVSASNVGGSNLPTAMLSSSAQPTAAPVSEEASAEMGDSEETETWEELPEEEEALADAGNFAGIDEDDPERMLSAEEENGKSEAEDTEKAEETAEVEEGESAVTAEKEEPEEPAPQEVAAAVQPEAENEGTEEVQERPVLTVSAAESADPSLISTTQIFNGNKKVRQYARAADDQIQMPTLGEYTRQKMGILTFRGDAFRQNASIGTAEALNTLELAWTAEAGSAKGASGTMYYGVGVGSQPAIIKWSKEVREQSDLYESKKEKTGLREVIVAGQDGRIYFLDLSDGTATRNSIKLGYPMRSTPSLHPSGAPYMTVGQLARKMARGTGTIGLRQYNLYTMKEMSLIDGLDAKNNRPYNNIGSFETSALIDRKTGTMVTAGTNGMLYVIKLNAEFDYGAGVYTQSPTQVVLRSKAKKEKDAETAVEASVAMYDHYVYYADMGGYLRCVDTNSMTVAWAVALGDAVESTPALDWHGTDGLDLYTATEMTAKKKGDAEIKCFDALTGEERWSVGVGVVKDSKSKVKSVAGFRASPVVGQNSLSEYVYYVVNRLSDEGREKLGVSENTDAAVIALRKEDGSIVWTCPLEGNGYSSPVAVYNGSGEGVIIQCCGNGTVLMLDGKTGRERASLQLDGAIEASPAVYNNMMVIATSEKNKNNIYGIRIQ